MDRQGDGRDLNAHRAARAARPAPLPVHAEFHRPAAGDVAGVHPRDLAVYRTQDDPPVAPGGDAHSFRQIRARGDGRLSPRRRHLVDLVFRRHDRYRRLVPVRVRRRYRRTAHELQAAEGRRDHRPGGLADHRVRRCRRARRRGPSRIPGTRPRCHRLRQPRRRAGQRAGAHGGLAGAAARERGLAESDGCRGAARAALARESLAALSQRSGGPAALRQLRRARDQADLVSVRRRHDLTVINGCVADLEASPQHRSVAGPDRDLARARCQRAVLFSLARAAHGSDAAAGEITGRSVGGRSLVPGGARNRCSGRRVRRRAAVGDSGKRRAEHRLGRAVVRRRYRG